MTRPLTKLAVILTAATGAWLLLLAVIRLICWLIPFTPVQLPTL